MFLTNLDHEGHAWTVELRTVPSEERSGLLEFSFTRPAIGEPVRLTWHVRGDVLKSLTQGTEMSEELLRRQLSVAIAEARTVDASGVGSRSSGDGGG